MTATYDYLFKFIVIGDTNVGKSCLSLRFTENKYNPQHNTTLGVEFASKNIKVHDYVIKIQIWDTAGQQSFKSITRSYYRGSIAAFIIYDITSRDSFDNVARWIEQVRTHSHEKVSLMLVGNKSDLPERREVTTQDGQQLAKRYGFDFIETSAKSGDKVEELFCRTTEQILRKIQKRQLDPDTQAVSPELIKNFGIRRGKTKKIQSTISIENKLPERDRQPQNTSSCNC